MDHSGEPPGSEIGDVPHSTISVHTDVRHPETDDHGEKTFELRNLSVSYGKTVAVSNVSMDVFHNDITALIGPSGCGKTTVIRCLNRMNDLIPSARVDGELLYHGQDLYAPEVDPVQVRKLIGMVFQKPNPFPKSIYDNIAFGPRSVGIKGNMDEIVEKALRRAALWDEVKDRLKDSAMGLSGGQQQRLCIARAIATLRIEELMLELKEDYSIIIVTHNMQQAARVSDKTAFFNVKLNETGMRTGYLVEYSPTEQLFTTPKEKDTEDYITGRFG